jgi:hypothetical protein
MTVEKFMLVAVLLGLACCSLYAAKASGEKF